MMSRMTQTIPENLTDGSVLGVVPLPGGEAAIVIVAHLVQVDAPRAPVSLPPRDFVIDRDARTVLVDGAEADLTYREFELLDYLSSSPGRVYTRRQLLAAVWDRYGEESGRTVDVHVLRLRRKLGSYAPRIVTVRNVGYKYQPSR
ncbi:winged helix-turn-helix transcriptional regulator [Streptosporangiaceae bacterium NEAU-GS5]|nr:winged helix-turn-helix transcriptional regulator [Streptosporangiaceae bacterium NEAU-GS5]